MYKMDFKKLLKKVGAYIVSAKQCKFFLAIFALYLGVAENNLAANGQFFQNITDKIENNVPRLSYGVAVTDFNNDGKMEFIVTGFRYPNLALSYENGSYTNINSSELFADEKRSSIGVVACDVDQDGYEEIYFLQLLRNVNFIIYPLVFIKCKRFNDKPLNFFLLWCIR